MKKILVIEDEATVRENIVELLQAEGYLTLEARDGEDGLHVIWEERPDLILCDIRMPRLDGYGVLARINEDASAAVIPFIFLTARTERSDMRMGMNLGAEDYITKPFTRNDILDAVKKRLLKRELLAQRAHEKFEEIQQKLSHSLPYELLTPLSVILSRSEALIEDPEVIKDANQIRNVGRDIRDASGKLLRLVQDYLDYAEFDAIEKDEKKRSQLRSEVVNFPDGLIREIGDSVSKEFGRTNDVNVVAEKVSLAISENYLLRIVESLLENAMSQSAKGTSVDLHATVLPNQEGTYLIRIQDHGRGLTDEEINEINGQTQKLELQGCVIQYLFIRRMVHFFNGRFRIESEPGKQTIVEVFLPCVRRKSGI